MEWNILETANFLEAVSSLGGRDEGWRGLEALKQAGNDAASPTSVVTEETFRRLTPSVAHVHDHTCSRDRHDRR